MSFMWKFFTNEETCELIRKLILSKGISNQDGFSSQEETIYSNLKFKRHIYKNKTTKNTLFVTTFVEFGCESFFPHYVVPELIKSNPDYHVVVLGWFGREYYYKHLASEFWELHEDFSYLRSFSRALKHNSKNIHNLELLLEKYGLVIRSESIANNLFKYSCMNCKKFGESNSNIKFCIKCFSDNIKPSLFYNEKVFHSLYNDLPEVSNEAVEYANRIIPDNSVGIFARNRSAYGRNLSGEFYKKLIKLIKDLGYNPIWLGEPCSTLPCPDSEILDLTKDKNVYDLEKTIAILKKCKFTVQFWTASTRLSMIAKTKYVLIESPDQIYGHGQEGQRLKLFNKDKSLQKLLLCNYTAFVSDIDKSLNIIKDSIEKFMNEKDNSIVVGSVDDQYYVKGLIHARS